MLPLDLEEIERLRAEARQQRLPWTFVDQSVAYDAAIVHLAQLCSRPEFSTYTREEFVHRVLACAGMVWDRDGLLFLVEAEVRQHFCEMWSDCESGCYLVRNPKQRPAWLDGWRSLSKEAARLRGLADPTGNATRERKRAKRQWTSARNFVSSKVRQHVFVRDGHACVHCKASYVETDLRVDHIIPVSRGGSSELSNLQTLCESCNQAKGDRRPDEAVHP